jgi:hypothetical protein
VATWEWNIFIHYCVLDSEGYVFRILEKWLDTTNQEINDRLSPLPLHHILKAVLHLAVRYPPITPFVSNDLGPIIPRWIRLRYAVRTFDCDKLWNVKVFRNLQVIPRYENDAIINKMSHGNTSMSYTHSVLGERFLNSSLIMFLNDVVWTREYTLYWWRIRCEDECWRLYRCVSEQMVMVYLICFILSYILACTSPSPKYNVQIGFSYWNCELITCFRRTWYMCCSKQYKIKVKLSVCWTNEALRHKDVWRSGRIDPRILDLGTSWRWVVSFTPRSLYPQGDSPRLDEPQNRSGRRGEGKILPLQGLELRPLVCTARSPSLYRLSYPDF